MPSMRQARPSVKCRAFADDLTRGTPCGGSCPLLGRHHVISVGYGSAADRWDTLPITISAGRDNGDGACRRN